MGPPEGDGDARSEGDDPISFGMEVGVGERWGPDGAVVTTEAGGTIHIDRRARRSTLRLQHPPRPEAVVHPHVASTAVVAAHWLGRASFHAGGFLAGGRVWGVLGGRELGKSSLLAGLHQMGVPVVADDVLVLGWSGATVLAYAGPRCLDLRRSAAERFEMGKPLGVVGNRERWRVDIPTIEPELPFAGWIHLGWAEGPPRLVELVPSDRLRALARHRGLTVPGVAPPRLLELATLPAHGFARPRDWTSFDAGLATLLGGLQTVRC